MSDQQTQSRLSGASNRDIAAIVLGVFVIALALANSRSVKIDWIVASWRMPLIIVIVGCLAIGMGIGYMLARRKAKPKDA